MKILSAQKVESVIVKTDDSEFPMYRRNDSDDWENLMGTSWEEVGYTDELEAAYQEWLKTNSQE